MIACAFDAPWLRFELNPRMASLLKTQSAQEYHLLFQSCLHILWADSDTVTNILIVLFQTIYLITQVYDSIFYHRPYNISAVLRTFRIAGKQGPQNRRPRSWQGELFGGVSRKHFSLLTVNFKTDYCACVLVSVN
jgi:hypothetical protein